MRGSTFFNILFMVGGEFRCLRWPGWTIACFNPRAGWAGESRLTLVSCSTYGTVMAVLSLSFLFGDAGCRWVMSELMAHGFHLRQSDAAKQVRESRVAVKVIPHRVHRQQREFPTFPRFHRFIEPLEGQFFFARECVIRCDDAKPAIGFLHGTKVLGHPLFPEAGHPA